jgi:hypothetical protein
MAKSLAYCSRTPGEPATTRPPFQRSGSRTTNCASWFQPRVVLPVEVSGKYPSIWMPGTPLGLRAPAEVSPAQSAGSVWPVATVPAVVRSVRQAAS